MKTMWYKRLAIPLAVALCMCAPTMAAEAEPIANNSSECLRQIYIGSSAYYGAEESYTGKVGDVIFYDFDRDGEAEGHGVIRDVGGIVAIGPLSFDEPSMLRGVWRSLPDFVMGYGAGRPDDEPPFASIAPDFVFI